MSAYLELLRHPKWQQRRLQILERAGFACEFCRDAESTLNVHHVYYESGRKPWEYPGKLLVCLCEPCHERNHDLWRFLQQMMVGFDNDFLDRAIDAVWSLREQELANNKRIGLSTIGLEAK